MPNNIFTVISFRFKRVSDEMKPLSIVARFSSNNTTYSFPWQSIGISVRKDEKRFDVGSSYNIRYEIMKKRLEKVCFQGTK